MGTVQLIKSRVLIADVAALRVRVADVERFADELAADVRAARRRIGGAS